MTTPKCFMIVLLFLMPFLESESVGYYDDLNVKDYVPASIIHCKHDTGRCAPATVFRADGLNIRVNQSFYTYESLEKLPETGYLARCYKQVDVAKCLLACNAINEDKMNRECHGVVVSPERNSSYYIVAYSDVPKNQQEKLADHLPKEECLIYLQNNQFK